MCLPQSVLLQRKESGGNKQRREYILDEDGNRVKDARGKEMFDGTIEVKSKLGQGTEFKVELYVEPAKAPCRQEKAVEKFEKSADAFDKEKKETLDAGMNRHMAKPIDPSALYEILSEYKNK